MQNFEEAKSMIKELPESSQRPILSQLEVI